MAEARDNVTERILCFGIAATAFTIYGVCTAPAPYLLDSAELGDRQVRGIGAWRAYSDAALACDNGLGDIAAVRLARLEALVPGDPRAETLRRRCGLTPLRAAP